LYLFLCQLEWRRTRNLAAYQELLAARDATDPDIRVVAEALLHDIHQAPGISTQAAIDDEVPERSPDREAVTVPLDMKGSL
jgi:hypothetical protein